MKKVELKHEWPVVALLGGGALAVLFFSRGSSSSSPSAIYPKVVGGQRGTQARSSSRASDTGTLASQVIQALIGQKVALTQAQDSLTLGKLNAKDQLSLGELELQTQQNIAYRESNVQAQQSVNSEVPPPNGWNQFFGMLFNALPMAFGFPPMGGGYSGGYGGGYGSSGYPWMGGSYPSGGYGGFYPGSYFTSPFQGMWG